ncbi:hypothetical protein TVAG_278700 [Trichomonas vaginalis G3]|uniref:Uncharacterized protein n=1 Tax=Trichomonas vaginalis (strain ATCC PRA-98 / G3) TaxID=412133 RepID=A2FXB9_TRIV3|nr:hypothetical protein TVAGG3_0103700 [Trichomonas vaginalis G3]EAX90449.1 hypothetical protein TVAG_278700 [Trichomonas vaginalis G3]KAI5544512.1 hypothetical protein TVAGG3_0103700 [Trichomonas vaginalis G3]|eukprot:XP_001303379.1 hypothetical protein [Trichomonas vaginalis G3]
MSSVEGIMNLVKQLKLDIETEIKEHKVDARSLRKLEESVSYLDDMMNSLDQIKRGTGTNMKEKKKNE